MATTSGSDLLIADRVWVATALLHRQNPHRLDFSKKEIRECLRAEGLMDGARPDTINNHLDQHCVANTAPSSGKYRMLYETPRGNLRLFRSGDFVHPGRVQQRRQSKVTPKLEDIPMRYRNLIDWYEAWVGQEHAGQAPASWEDDPLIRLIGSGKHIWADEHADEYVENLRREDPA